MRWWWTVVLLGCADGVPCEGEDCGSCDETEERVVSYRQEQVLALIANAGPDEERDYICRAMCEVDKPADVEVASCVLDSQLTALVVQATCQDEVGC